MAFIPSTKDQWVFCQILYKKRYPFINRTDAKRKLRGFPAVKYSMIESPCAMYASRSVIPVSDRLAVVLPLPRWMEA